MKSATEIDEAISKLVFKLNYYDECMCAESEYDKKVVFKRLYEETKKQIHLLKWVLND